MKKSSLIRLASLIGITLTGLAAHAQVINYHNAYNYAYGFNGGPDPGAPLYGSLVYVGQGAYSDPGHNVWNGFGGGFNPTSNGYSPGDAGHTTGTYPQYYSDGSAAPITLTVNYGFDNGGLNGAATGAGGTPIQGTPNLILGQEAGVNGSSPGIGTSGAPLGEFILHNVPTGIYTMYLYGQNFDANRGALFSLAGANGGTFAGGIDGTINDGTKNAFTLGVNYVIVNGVTPDGSGNITGFFAPNPADTLTGEGSFNGLQLIPVPEPSALAFLGLGMAGLLIFRRRK